MKNKAILVIDVQNGMFPYENSVYNGKELLNNLKKLLMNARTTNTPVFYIQHNASEGKHLENGTEGWEIHPEISPEESDVIIQKDTPDSFFNTDLESELKKKQVNHLIITGIQTEVCVDTTTRRAYSMGYDVTLITDTHSTWDSKEITAQQIINHHNQVLRWFADTKTSTEFEF
ncbi:cysteine hydrolase family protein [Psychrobacillus sp. MER TA 171]|uniref:cysteine hydrolase family protein n=1 Tax=Psychrobacillus sp. MER TA 171 TaxID=2939577 RepID=UPI00203BA1BD|nr:cysteine hydrolase family protein [Psychrobacillus sp. MER TA 171]MCM3358085.1 cysteine hydrolase [Psychrobacillus sp. MER TA 171]